MASYSWENELGRAVYAPPPSTAWNLRWWILLAVISSSLVHGGLYYLVKDIEISSQSAIEAGDDANKLDSIDDRVALDPKLLEMTLTASPEPVSTQNVPQEMTQELPSVDQLAPYLNGDLTATPQITTPQNINMSTRAKGDIGSTVDALSAVDTAIAGGVESKLQSAMTPKDMLKTMHAADDQVSIKIQERPPESNASLADVATARRQGNEGLKGMGYSSLDDLMDIKTPQTGDLKAMMPGDFLFDYNSVELREGAKLDLQKLGLLISTWTKSKVIVEGHTDSIGTEEYNLELSRRRAQSIKDYIARSLMVNVDRIEVRGMGESAPIVDPSGNEQQQAPNRRVVIRFINP
jgi:outer membrane protein OmpA-like peptidoglycan-associated protein